MIYSKENKVIEGIKSVEVNKVTEVNHHVESNVEVVRSFINEFWNERKLRAAEKWLVEDYVDHAYIPNNRDGLENMATILFDAFPDQHSSEMSVVAQGDRVVVRLRMTGTHLGNFRGTIASRQPIDVNLFREYRLENGKIAEHWALFDTVTLFRQIGAELNEQPACVIKK